jgi:hypothetical protein
MRFQERGVHQATFGANLSRVRSANFHDPLSARAHYPTLNEDCIRRGKPVARQMEVRLKIPQQLLIILNMTISDILEMGLCDDREWLYTKMPPNTAPSLGLSMG